jgi:hypothetical protein
MIGGYGVVLITIASRIPPPAKREHDHADYDG